jgi:hypothetical protein
VRIYVGTDWAEADHGTRPVPDFSSDTIEQRLTVDLGQPGRFVRRDAQLPEHVTRIVGMVAAAAIPTQGGPPIAVK